MKKTTPTKKQTKMSTKKPVKGIAKKASKPRVLILSGYGLNCEEETKFVFETAGGRADIVHINDLILDPKRLSSYQILVFPGGFSYGDDMGSGKAYASKLRNHLGKELEQFIARDTLTIGICNGFQIMTNLGLLPGGLAHNEGGRYIDRWVDLEVTGKSPWLAGIKKISLPVAHGEGKYIIDAKGYKKLQAEKSIAFKYTKGEICEYQSLIPNPNGALHDIAGVLSHDGRVLGMMPHPERAIFFHHQPNWQTKKELYKSKQKPLPEFGPSLTLFTNAINYFKN
jgi:phosphoribosylformylglycinamidine synthase I